VRSNYRWVVTNERSEEFRCPADSRLPRFFVGSWSGVRRVVMVAAAGVEAGGVTVCRLR
jgi:hypothetical protein